VHGNTRTLLTALAAAGLAAGAVACSGGPDQGAGADQPTFQRSEGASLAYEEPIATTSDLLAPTAEGEPWIIVGSLLDPEEGASAAAVWTSEDAKEWTRQDVQPLRSGLGESMAAAVPTEDGLLAVGRLGDGERSDAVVWRQDGDEWEQMRPEAMGGDHEQWAFDVAAGAGGILVAGGENTWGEVRARLWFSADGETWESVDGGPGGPLDATGEESVRDVASFGSGFVAVGSRRVDGEQDGVVWVSPDGKSWEQVDSPVLGGPGRQEVAAVVDTGAGLVAGGFSTGEGGAGVPVSWSSPDGRTWAGSLGGPLQTHQDARRATSDMTIRSLSVDPAGIVAAGGDRWRPQVWRSVDGGASWLLAANPVHGEVNQDGVRIDDAAAANGINGVAIGSGPSVMVLGTRWEDVTTDAFPRGGAQPFAASVAAGPEATVAAGGLYTPPAGGEREKFAGEIWVREGNGDWDTVNTDALSSGQVLDVVAYKGGFAAVGTEDFALATLRGPSGDNGPDGMVWISPDGEAWGRIGITNAQIESEWLAYLDNPDPSFADDIVAMEQDLPPESTAPAGGPGTRELSAAAPLLDGFIAVGTVFDSVDTDPIVLYSLDGTTLVPESPGIGGPGPQRLSDVCVGPDSTAVAVGVGGATGGHEAVVIQRNPDDGVWSGAVAEDGSFGGPGNQIAYACAAGPDGFVVVGSDDSSGDTDARIWTSPDGREWTQVVAGPLGGGGDQWASAVALVPGGDDGDGWLVAGVDTGAGNRDIALWRLSADGELTRRDRGESALGGPGDQTVSSVSVDEEGHVTLAGSDYGRVGLWESDRLDR
jgi:hypothetical protein